MRGLLRNLVTRLYFPDEPANLTDPILQLVPAERRSTLIAQTGGKPGTLHWDIVMREQESNAKPETVFFAW
jgi:protocatechuate 3,4-dioxygenase alpha subunit